MHPRRGRALLRDLYRDYTRIERGEGVYLYDEQGHRYLDGAEAPPRSPTSVTDGSGWPR